MKPEVKTLPVPTLPTNVPAPPIPGQSPGSKPGAKPQTPGSWLSQGAVPSKAAIGQKTLTGQ